jgi:ParB/RepB/Spo0J family partition protein
MSLKIDDMTKGKFDNLQKNSFMELDITKVYPNPNQPRKEFDDEHIQELSNSIVKNGLMQPIAVTKVTDTGKYMIISGECRYKAHLLADLPTIKAHIIDADDKQIDELSLIENIQRKDLTPCEIALFIRRLWESGTYEKKKDLADKIGKKDTYVSKALSVSSLDDNIIEDIKKHKLDIGLSVLDEISRVGDYDFQNMVYDKYKSGVIKRDDIKKFKSKADLRDDEESTPQKQSTNSNKLPTREEIEYQFPNLTIENIKDLHKNMYFDKHRDGDRYCVKIQVQVYPEKKIPIVVGDKPPVLSKSGMGFGTVNDIGTYVAIIDGDFKGTFEFEEGGEFMKTTNNKEYRITIEEL